MEEPRSLTGARAIARAFAEFREEFEACSRRARERFERRDWAGMQRDARSRLDLYRAAVDGVVASLRGVLGDDVSERQVWAAMKRRFAAIVSNRGDAEIAETFFNSATRRLFSTVGVDSDIEFFRESLPNAPDSVAMAALAAYPAAPDLRHAIVRVLGDCGFTTPFEDLERDAAFVAERIREYVHERPDSADVQSIEVLRSVFFRNKGAYVIGRMRCGPDVLPLVVALGNDGGGIFVDAVLCTPSEASVVFSFTRSHFHVETERPLEIVTFLRSLMPRKPLDELYTSIGFHKHGKTLLYRDLRRHVKGSVESFEEAPGTRGMVMTVFTLPSYDVVFKVIRDRFDYPKTATRADVMDRYRLVFEHDRAGRLVGTQEFEHVTFDRVRFPDRLLAELLATASNTVRLEGDRVVVRHLYAERRLEPLNLYLDRVSGDAAISAVVDFGNAVKDLARANVFPGDLLLKNFGVTSQGRVAFFDYDEVCLVTDCVFRQIPAASSVEDELSAEPWFHVGPNDVFPEEFRSFLGLDGVLRDAYESAHADLFGVRFWRDVQSGIRAGEIADIVPYRSERRQPRSLPG